MFTEQRRYGLDPTVVTRTKTWGQPKKWQKEAAATNTKQMVFTCSWSDFFIEQADPWRDEAWKVIKNCPNLIFQVLTKRPELIQSRLPADWGTGYDNVGLGVSVENDKYLGRVDLLRQIPAKIHFISAEPLLGSIKDIDLTDIEWLIAGGESGPNFRIMDLQWAREIRDKCVANGVAFFYKQGSALLPGRDNVLDGQVWEQWPKEWMNP
jgi:protein gp37